MASIGRHAGPDLLAVAMRGIGHAQPALRGGERPPTAAQPGAAGLSGWRHPLARRWDRWCRQIETWLARRTLVIDLRVDPGSRRWFGGVARLLAYTAPAIVCWPSFAPLEATPLPLPDTAALIDMRAQAIGPLIAGGATGRHFAATERVRRLDSVPERATIALTAVLGENDDLTHMLQRIGLRPLDAEAVRALTAPLGTPVPGTRFAITLGARSAPGEPRPLSVLTFRPRFDLELTVARSGNGLTLHKQPIPVDATPLHLVGAVGGSLYRAARAAGAAPDTVQTYLQAIDQYMPIETIAPDDRFELIVAHKKALGAPAQDAHGLSAGEDGELLYAGIVRDGKPLLQVMRWGNDGNFYTAQALESESGQGSGLLAAPVAGNITSWFGMRRHPILGYVRMHSGVDFAAHYGAPIYAASDGVVSYAGWHGGHGNYVRLAHGGGIATGYGHMSQIAVSPGTHVARGQVIGYVGSTGLSTGPHLHYELFRDGTPVDPLSIRFVPHHTVVSPGEVAGFKARMRQLLAVPRLVGG